MKLLFISSTVPPLSTPESAHTAQLCQQLAARGIEVHLLTTKQENIPSDLPCTVYPIMEKWDWSEMPRMARCIKACAPDVVLLMYVGLMYHNEPMITFAPTLCKRILSRSVRFVTQFENVMGAYDKTRLSRLCRRVAKRVAGKADVALNFGTLFRDSDHLIFLSAHHLEQANAHLAVRSKSSVIPVPPLMQVFAPNPEQARREERRALGLNENDFLFLYFGYLYVGKGIDTMIRAFHQAQARFPNARLIIVGGLMDYNDPKLSAPVKAFQALPGELGIEAKVIWTGYLEGTTDRVSRYMYAADIGVLPFDFGIQLNNSSFATLAKHSLPVISTEGAKLEPEFVHGENIYICPPKDPAAMADGMERLMTDAKLRHRLICGTEQLSDEYFSWEQAMQKTVQILES